MKKLNTKSKVWQNFEIMATEDGKITKKEKDKPIGHVEAVFKQREAT